MNTKNQKPLFPEALPNHCPDLTYEEIEEFDDVLDDYLALCMEIYWQKVEDGSFPWPEDVTLENSTDVEIPDSTL